MPDGFSFRRRLEFYKLFDTLTCPFDLKKPDSGVLSVRARPRGRGVAGWHARESKPHAAACISFCVRLEDLSSNVLAARAFHVHNIFIQDNFEPGSRAQLLQYGARPSERSE